MSQFPVVRAPAARSFSPHLPQFCLTSHPVVSSSPPFLRSLPSAPVSILCSRSARAKPIGKCDTPIYSPCNCTAASDVIFFLLGRAHGLFSANHHGRIGGGEITALVGLGNLTLGLLAKLRDGQRRGHRQNTRRFLNILLPNNYCLLPRASICVRHSTCLLFFRLALLIVARSSLLLPSLSPTTPPASLHSQQSLAKKATG